MSQPVNDKVTFAASDSSVNIALRAEQLLNIYTKFEHYNHPIVIFNYKILFTKKYIFLHISLYL